MGLRLLMTLVLCISKLLVFNYLSELRHWIDLFVILFTYSILTCTSNVEVSMYV